MKNKEEKRKNRRIGKKDNNNRVGQMKGRARLHTHD